MKLEKGKLSVGLWDVLAVVLLPLTLLLLPVIYMNKKLDSAEPNDQGFYFGLITIYSMALLVGGIWFAIMTTTCHREIVEVETTTKTVSRGGEWSPASEEEVVDMAFITLEERPKLFNTDQVKYWHYCRSDDGNWFLVEENGDIVECENSGWNADTWELNRYAYLEYLYKQYQRKLEAEQAKATLKDRIRNLNPWQ